MFLRIDICLSGYFFLSFCHYVLLNLLKYRYLSRIWTNGLNEMNMILEDYTVNSRYKKPPL